MKGLSVHQYITQHDTGCSYGCTRPNRRVMPDGSYKMLEITTMTLCEIFNKKLKILQNSKYAEAFYSNRSVTYIYVNSSLTYEYIHKLSHVE